MTYATNLELRKLTGTALADSILTEILNQADRHINAKLYAMGLSPSYGSDSLKGAALDLGQAGVLMRHRMDGTAPDSLTVGDLTMSTNIDEAIRYLTDRADKTVDAYADYTLTLESSRAKWVYKVNG